MPINPLRECYAYADIGPRKHLEIRKVGGNLEPFLCTADGEQLITSHNLPRGRDLAHVISKLARGYVKVTHSSGEWHVAYDSKCHAQGFSALVIPPQQAPRTETQEATKEGKELSENSNPVGSNLHSGNESHSSSHSRESSTELVEEGGAPGENIPSFGKRNPEPNSPRSTISADRVSFFSSQELPYLASTAALGIDGGAVALQPSGLSQGAVQGSEIVLLQAAIINTIGRGFEKQFAEQEKKIDLLMASMSSLATQLKRDIKQEISAKMSEEFLKFEDRIRKERAKERAADKEEERQERAKERAADKEEERQERAKERAADSLSESTVDDSIAIFPSNVCEPVRLHKERLQVAIKPQGETPEEWPKELFREFEEGGAAGENIPTSENRGNVDSCVNLEVNPYGSPISADRVSLLSLQELPYLSSAAALVVEGGGINLLQATIIDALGVALKRRNAKLEKLLAEREKKIDLLMASLSSLATQLKTDIAQEISAKMSEEFVNSEDRARRERAQERAVDKEEARQERAQESIAHKEEPIKRAGMRIG